MEGREPGFVAKDGEDDTKEDDHRPVWQPVLYQLEELGAGTVKHAHVMRLLSQSGGYC